jgi:hypothetical protein
MIGLTSKAEGGDSIALRDTRSEGLVRKTVIGRFRGRELAPWMALLYFVKAVTRRPWQSAFLLVNLF